METSIRLVPTANAPETSHDHASRHIFLDENGQPSSRSGPDLTLAEPIDQVIARLKRLRTSHSVAFYRACNASGIYLSVLVTRNGHEQLSLGLPCDSQQELREPRFKALEDHLHSTAKRRQGVLDLVNFLGHFSDNRPYASVKEAADKLLSAGGRIYILSDGRCEEVLPYNDKRMLSDSWEGYPTMRMKQRYGATLRQKGARDELIKLVQANGKLHEGSGATVWELEG